MNQGNLMELVETCERESENETKVDSGLATAGDLEKAGMSRAAATLMQELEIKDKKERIAKYGYIKITYEKVKKFLNSKAESYNNTHPKVSECNGGVFMAGNMHGMTISCDPAMAESQDLWIDGKKHSISTSPPHETQRKREHRKLISCYAQTNDYYSADNNSIGKFVWQEHELENYPGVPPKHILDAIVEHKSRNVFDYLTIAEVKGLHDPLLLGRLDDIEDAYFITQWGNDIQLDDVI